MNELDRAAKEAEAMLPCCCARTADINLLDNLLDNLDWHYANCWTVMRPAVAARLRELMDEIDRLKRALQMRTEDKS